MVCAIGLWLRDCVGGGVRRGLAAAAAAAATAAAAAADITGVKELNGDEGTLRLISQRCVLHLQTASPASLSSPSVGAPFVRDERGWWVCSFVHAAPNTHFLITGRPDAAACPSVTRVNKHIHPRQKSPHPSKRLGKYLQRQ